MYNTVGETAGVTQDVGSDPTVRDSDFDSDVYFCCTLCGMEEGVQGWVVGEEREKGAGVRVCDLSEMSEMDEEMDGEADTTGDDPDMTETHGGDKADASERCKERDSPSTDPEHKTG